MAEPDITVVIVSWNARGLLESCLESLHAQEPGVDREIICVDNASRDGSADLVRSRFPNVTLLENDLNRGFVGANNQAMAMARGRYVLLLNSDTIVPPGSLRALLRVADSRPRGAVFGCKVAGTDSSPQPSCFMFPSALNMLLSATYLYKLFPSSRFYGRQNLTYWKHDSERLVEAVSGCCALVRRSAIDEVGPMDPAFFFYGDDLDWCYRFRAAGWEVRFTPEACITHLGGGSSRLMRREFKLQLLGSTILFARLHYPLVSFVAIRLLSACFCGLRAQYWLLLSLRQGDRGRRALEEAGTYSLGFRLCLSGWTRLLMNRQEVLERLKTGKNRSPRSNYARKEICE